MAEKIKVKKWHPRMAIEGLQRAFKEPHIHLKKVPQIKAPNFKDLG